jgi:hypothetical protein
MSNKSNKVLKNKIQNQKKQATTILGTSRIQELKNEDIRRSKTADARSLFKDKNRLATHLYLTKMCNSFLSGQPCRNGTDCAFAHTPEQLRHPDCPYAELCDKVIQAPNGTWYNNKLCKCTLRHPGETDSHINIRLEKQITILKRSTATIPPPPPPLILVPPPPPLILVPPPPPLILAAPPSPIPTPLQKPTVREQKISWAEFMDEHDAIINVTPEEAHRVLDQMIAAKKTDIHFHIC